MSYRSYKTATGCWRRLVKFRHHDEPAHSLPPSVWRSHWSPSCLCFLASSRSNWTYFTSQGAIIQKEWIVNGNEPKHILYFRNSNMMTIGQTSYWRNLLQRTDVKKGARLCNIRRTRVIKSKWWWLLKRIYCMLFLRLSSRLAFRGWFAKTFFPDKSMYEEGQATVNVLCHEVCHQVNQLARAQKQLTLPTLCWAALQQAWRRCRKWDELLVKRKRKRYAGRRTSQIPLY